MGAGLFNRDDKEVNEREKEREREKDREGVNRVCLC
jgi:hypothetical protein